MVRSLKGAAVAAAAAASAAALLLVLAGCAPPYLVELDLAAPITRAMTMVGALPPVSLSTTETSPRLLPPKPTATSLDALNVQSGFLVTESTGLENLSYVYIDSGGNVQIAGSPSISTSGADQHYPFNQFEVAATTTTANLVLYHMDPNNASLDTAALYTAGLPPSGSLTNSLSAAALASFNANGYPVIGESVIPVGSGGPDSFRWLLADMGGNFEEISTTLQGTTSVFNSVTPTLTAMPLPTLPRFLYYTGARSYVQYYSGGWVCLDITSSTSPVQLTGITHRIDALLSTGDLVSTENGTLTLYDASGSQLLSKPMGGLNFCYEAFIGTTPYCFFTLPVAVRHEQYAFVVYAVPSSSMRNL